MAGLGKLSPNLLLVGFKSDWKKNLGLNTEFFNTLICAFEQRLSVTILRVKDGFDYSSKLYINYQIKRTYFVIQHFQFQSFIKKVDFVKILFSEFSGLSF